MVCGYADRVQFNRQCEALEEWLEIWSDEGRKYFVECLIAKCAGEQLEFLFSVMEPIHHRGFIYTAQHQLSLCPSISTPASRHEALLFALNNVAKKYFRPKSVVLKSKEDIDGIVNENSSSFSLSSGGLYKSSRSRKIPTKRCKKEVSNFLQWYENDWSDKLKLESLYLVLCRLSVQELYYTTLLLNLRRYRDFITKLPTDLTLRILSYLSAKDLINASEVSKEWHSICTSDMVWGIKCVQKSTPPAPTEGIPQQLVFKRSVLLARNWEGGRCRAHCFSPASHKLLSVAFEAKTGKIATGLVNGDIKIWTLGKSGGTLNSTLISHTKGVWCLEWYKTACLVSCSSDGSIKIWNVKKGLCQKSADGAHDGQKVWVLKCHGDLMYTGGEDKMARCWDIKRCEMVQLYSGHTGSVFSLDVKESVLVTGSADKLVKVWNSETGECLRSITVTRASPGWVMSVSISLDCVAVACNKNVTVYHLETGIPVKQLSPHSEPVEKVRLVLSDDRNTRGVMATCSKDGLIRYWLVDHGRQFGPPHTLEGHKEGVNDITVTGTAIVSVGADRALRVWKFSPLSLTGAVDTDPPRRKTLVSGGLGEVTLLEYPYDEQVKYESELTKLYKKHLTKRLTSKSSHGDAMTSVVSLTSSSDASMTPVETIA